MVIVWYPGLNKNHLTCQTGGDWLAGPRGQGLGPATISLIHSLCIGECTLGDITGHYHCVSLSYLEGNNMRFILGRSFTKTMTHC